MRKILRKNENDYRFLNILRDKMFKLFFVTLHLSYRMYFLHSLLLLHWLLTACNSSNISSHYILFYFISHHKGGLSWTVQKRQHVRSSQERWRWGHGGGWVRFRIIIIIIIIITIAATIIIIITIIVMIIIIIIIIIVIIITSSFLLWTAQCGIFLLCILNCLNGVTVYYITLIAEHWIVFYCIIINWILMRLLVSVLTVTLQHKSMSNNDNKDFLFINFFNRL